MSLYNTNTRVRFLCVPLSLLSPFPVVIIASAAVWITLFDRFGRCLNIFQSITKHWSSTFFETFYLLPYFGIRSVSCPQRPFDYNTWPVLAELGEYC